MVAEFFTVLGVEVGIPEKHGKSSVAHSSCELDIRGALACGEGGKLMTQVMEMVVGEIGALNGLHPRFLDVDAAKGRFTGKDQGLGGITSGVKSL